ncbi:MAG: hypothetical protein H6Q10_3321 [Acidobacteria bacterium]|nr:hypothetical protein [Acidobacteriota bacterium]
MLVAAATEAATSATVHIRASMSNLPGLWAGSRPILPPVRRESTDLGQSGRVWLSGGSGDVPGVVRFVLRHDRRGVLRFASLEGAFARTGRPIALAVW